MADRCDFVGTDMFQSVPAGGDAYILKAIVHDWSDDEAIQILRNCGQGIRDDGKALLIEFVVKVFNQTVARWLGLNMRVILPGRERSGEEFRNLYAAAASVSAGLYLQADFRSPDGARCNA